MFDGVWWLCEVKLEAWGEDEVVGAGEDEKEGRRFLGGSWGLSSQKNEGVIACKGHWSRGNVGSWTRWFDIGSIFCDGDSRTAFCSE